MKAETEKERAVRLLAEATKLTAEAVALVEQAREACLAADNLTRIAKAILSKEVFH